MNCQFSLSIKYICARVSKNTQNKNISMSKGYEKKCVYFALSVYK